jgi:hypothetical protein
LDLSARAARYLAWVPDVALDPDFHAYLSSRGLHLGARGLQGLVRACHMRWSAYVKNQAMKRNALRCLKEYSGPNRVIALWQRSTNLILEESAPEALATVMLTGLRKPQSIAEAWRVDAGSEFFLAAMRGALKEVRRQWRQDSRIAPYLCQEILVWDGWPMDAFKGEVSECVLHADARDAHVNGPLKGFILRHPRLGDPRLPANRNNWLGVRVEARQRVIEWLSRDDIVFFFDHAFPKGGDPH